MALLVRLESRAIGWGDGIETVPVRSVMRGWADPTADGAWDGCTDQPSNGDCGRGKENGQSVLHRSKISMIFFFLLFVARSRLLQAAATMAVPTVLIVGVAKAEHSKGSDHSKGSGVVFLTLGIARRQNIHACHAEFASTAADMPIMR